ncbi:MAG: hypothetical protein HRU15_04460 [Planctomycetes bacterium]|nr:hypothetical protein [Planctomycetota bacterium]
MGKLNDMRKSRDDYIKSDLCEVFEGYVYSENWEDRGEADQDRLLTLLHKAGKVELGVREVIELMGSPDYMQGNELSGMIIYITADPVHNGWLWMFYVTDGNIVNAGTNGNNIKCFCVDGEEKFVHEVNIPFDIGKFYVNDYGE